MANYSEANTSKNHRNRSDKQEFQKYARLHKFLFIASSRQEPAAMAKSITLSSQAIFESKISIGTVLDWDIGAITW